MQVGLHIIYFTKELQTVIATSFSPDKIKITKYKLESIAEKTYMKNVYTLIW